MADKEADKVLARELAIFAANDFMLYKQRLEPFTLNYARRKVNGKFDKKLAVQGLANNLARDVLIKYWRESAGGTPPVMNQATKTAFGEEMLEDMEDAINDRAKEMKAGRIDMFGREKKRVAKKPIRKRSRVSKGIKKGSPSIKGIR